MQVKLKIMLTKNAAVYKITNEMKEARAIPNKIQMRLIGDDLVRYQKIFALARERNEYASDSAINRELIGLDTPKLLSETEILFFLGRVDSLELSRKSASKGAMKTKARLTHPDEIDKPESDSKAA